MEGLRGLLAACIGLALLAPVAQAADPAPFASTSGVCEGTDGSASFGTQSARHEDVLLRTTSTGDIRLGYGYPPYYFVSSMSLMPGEARWVTTDNDVDPGSAPGLDCRGTTGQNGSFTAALYDIPLPPATFTGVTPYDDESGSRFSFEAPGTAQYVADVAVSQGAVEVWLSPFSASQKVVSAGQVAFGTLGAGTHSVNVEALDGPPANWRVTVRMLPAVLTGPSFSADVAQPGDSLTAGYEVSGDGRVSATVVNATGAVVRTLANDLEIKAGKRSLTWDGLTAGGDPLRDGRYRLQLSFVDRGGHVANGEAGVTLDGTAPKIKMTSSTKLKRKKGAAFKITDLGSGVDAASLYINGYAVRNLPEGSSSLTFRPSGGWQVGRLYKATVVARDNAGNLRTYRRSFRARR